MTLNTLKGITESIQTDIYKAIGIAYEQAVRSIKYIAQGKCFHKTINGKEKEIKLDNTEKNISFVSQQKISELFHLRYMNMLNLIRPYLSSHTWSTYMT